MNSDENKIRLTHFAHGAGCGCKISPAVLDEILSGNESAYFPNLLVGNDRKDDAAILQFNETEALISTTDFFTPIVDDAFLFGKIAAANALSDVYAMGGSPVLALAVLGWPVEKLPSSLANQVIKGAIETCKEAGIPLAGGHSIDTPEPFFGLSVNGIVKLNKLKRNNTIQEGDYLFITKPLGIGILTTAAKRNQLLIEDEENLHHTITQLNKIGAEISKFNFVNAMTDVTGFGLAGHLLEMLCNNCYSAEIYADKIPLLPNLEYYMNKFIVPDATYRNWKAYHENILIESDVNATHMFHLLPDPQTNGGILFSVNPEGLNQITDFLSSHNLKEYSLPIGRIISRNEKPIIIKNLKQNI
jgi:selenide,water dikinase